MFLWIWEEVGGVLLIIHISGGDYAGNHLVEVSFGPHSSCCIFQCPWLSPLLSSLAPSFPSRFSQLCWKAATAPVCSWFGHCCCVTPCFMRVSFCVCTGNVNTFYIHSPHDGQFKAHPAMGFSCRAGCVLCKVFHMCLLPQSSACTTCSPSSCGRNTAAEGMICFPLGETFPGMAWVPSQTLWRALELSKAKGSLCSPCISPSAQGSCSHAGDEQGVCYSNFRRWRCSNLSFSQRLLVFSCRVMVQTELKLHKGTSVCCLNLLHTTCTIYGGTIPRECELCILSKPLELFINIDCCLFVLPKLRKSYRGQKQLKSSLPLTANDAFIIFKPKNTVLFSFFVHKIAFSGSEFENRRFNIMRTSLLKEAAC